MSLLAMCFDASDECAEHCDYLSSFFAYSSFSAHLGDLNIFISCVTQHTALQNHLPPLLACIVNLNMSTASYIMRAEYGCLLYFQSSFYFVQFKSLKYPSQLHYLSFQIVKLSLFRKNPLASIPFRINVRSIISRLISQSLQIRKKINNDVSVNTCIRVAKTCNVT